LSGTETPPSAELALLRGELMTALARIEGDVRLVLQAQQQGTARVDEIVLDVRRLDDRVDVVERTAVTRAEFEQRETQARAAADERIRRQLTVFGLILTAVFGALTVSVAVIAIITN
jgi:hypothetical protein